MGLPIVVKQESPVVRRSHSARAVNVQTLPLDDGILAGIV